MTKLIVSMSAVSLLATYAHATTDLNFDKTKQKAVRVRAGGAVEYLDLKAGTNEVMLVDPDVTKANFNKDGNIVLVSGTTTKVLNPLTKKLLDITYDPETGKTTITFAGSESSKTSSGSK